MKTNPYCEPLGIPVPRLETATTSRDASPYSLLIATLLERGEPVTLDEAAARFEAAGVAPAARALASLKRCRPARSPIYRDGDRYALDPFDDEASLWAFRLGLKPAESDFPTLRVVRADPESLPDDRTPITVPHLDKAWQFGIPSTWSAQRVALCVLDAHGRAMTPDAVLSFVRPRSHWSPLQRESAKWWRSRAIRIHDDGRWELEPDHAALRSARKAVAERIEMVRRYVDRGPDPAVLAAMDKQREKKRQAQARELARMPRVLVHGFPAEALEALVLVDIVEHELTTYFGDEIPAAVATLERYEVIVGVEVRALLRALGFDPGQRRLAELGPPQKTRQLDGQRRTLKITPSLLIQGSCGISRPLGDPEKLRGYLAAGQRTRLLRRLERDGQSLYALYQYGRLHRRVRLRWGLLDEPLRIRWVYRSEDTLYELMDEARVRRVPLEVVVGSAPGWKDPWSRAEEVRVATGEHGWDRWLVARDGRVIDEADVQAARLAGE